MRVIATAMLILLSMGTSRAAEKAFAFSNSAIDVQSDPSGIWKEDEIAPVAPSPSAEKSLKDAGRTAAPGANIYEFKLVSSEGVYTLSQLSDDNCTAQLCPTRLILTRPDGSKELKFDDFAVQITPPDQAATKGLEPPSAQFWLSDDGHTLIQGRSPDPKKGISEKPKAYKLD